MTGGRVEGKVAFVTGAARGQGRAHCVRLAEEGADVIAVDILADYPSVAYPMATADDLAETAALVDQLGRRIVTGVGGGEHRAALLRLTTDGLFNQASEPLKPVTTDQGEVSFVLMTP